MSNIVFSGYPTSGYADTSIVFSSGIYGDVESCFWNFGDGFISQEENPEHTYACPCIYDVYFECSYKPRTPGIHVNETGYVTLTTDTDYLNSLKDGSFGFVVITIPESGNIDDDALWDAQAGAVDNPALYYNGAPVTEMHFQWASSGANINHTLTPTFDSVNDWVMTANGSASWASFNGEAVNEDAYGATLVAANTNTIRIGADADNPANHPGSVSFGFFAVLDLSNVTVNATFSQNLADTVNAVRSSYAYDPERIRQAIIAVDSNITGVFWKLDEAGRSGSANGLTLTRYKVEDGSVDSTSGGTTSSSGCTGCTMLSSEITISVSDTRTDYISIFTSDNSIPENQCCFGPYTTTCIGCSSGSGTRFYDSSKTYRVCRNVNCTSSCVAEYGASYTVNSDYTDDCPTCRECYLEDTELGRYYDLTITNCQVYVTSYIPDNTCGDCLQLAGEHCFSLDSCNTEGETRCLALFTYDDQIFQVVGDEGVCGPDVDCGSCWEIPNADIAEPFDFLPEDLDTCDVEEDETTTTETVVTGSDTATPPVITWHNTPDFEVGLGTDCNAESVEVTTVTISDELEKHFSLAKPDVAIMPSGHAVIAYEQRAGNGMTKINAVQKSTSVGDKVVNWRSLGKGALLNEEVEGLRTFRIYDSVNVPASLTSLSIGFKNGPLAGQLYSIDSITRQPLPVLLYDTATDMQDVYVSVDNNKIYIMEWGDSSVIHEMDLAGNGAVSHTSQARMRGFTVDETNYVFYTLRQKGTSSPYEFAINSKTTASLSASWSEILTFTSTSTTAYAIDIDVSNGLLYYSRPGQIRRCTTTGSNDTLIYTVSDTFTPTLKLDTTNGHIYWTEYNDRRIRRCNLNGSGATTILDNASNEPYGLSIDASKELVYWSDFDTGKIQSVDFDGTNKKAVIGPEAATGIGSDAVRLNVVQDYLYWINGSQSGTTNFLASTKLHRMPISLRPYYEVKFTESIS